MALLVLDEDPEDLVVDWSLAVMKRAFLFHIGWHTISPFRPSLHSLSVISESRQRFSLTPLHSYHTLYAAIDLIPIGKKTLVSVLLRLNQSPHRPISRIDPSSVSATVETVGRSNWRHIWPKRAMPKARPAVPLAPLADASSEESEGDHPDPDDDGEDDLDERPECSSREPSGDR